MSEPITAGFFPSHGSLKAGYIRVFAWQAPEFGPKDPDLGKRPKLFPLRSIIVERYVEEASMHGPRVRWTDGTEISPWERKGMRLSVRRRIDKAIAETWRMAGGRKRKA